MGGASDYVKDRWNVMDFFMNSLYLATISTKICAYMKHMGLSEGFGLNNGSDLATSICGKPAVHSSFGLPIVWSARMNLILRTKIKMKNIEGPNGTHFTQH